jgi:PelA/Pel-15E family pectate lyase
MAQDSVAERMLIYQRANGGWPQPGGNPINYNKPLDNVVKRVLLAQKNEPDATIDDDATTREIRGLMSAYQRTNNPAYRNAAEKGIVYLLSAQNKAGGWPQFYPDSGGYHKHITYNDQAMVNVLWVMSYTANGTHDFNGIDPALVPKAKAAVERGIDCILKTQVVQKGTLTVWCAQHDSQTLKPAKARKFELPSLSGNESVGIVEFLMSINNPSAPVKQAINAVVTWLDRVKITGYRVENILDPKQPSGRDRVIVADPTSTIWARFYDLETNIPFFTGRDSEPHATLVEVENERRIGYAYYGTWPAKLLAKHYPAWVQKWGK